MGNPTLCEAAPHALDAHRAYASPDHSGAAGGGVQRDGALRSDAAWPAALEPRRGGPSLACGVGGAC
jgi:hypothetical protein